MTQRELVKLLYDKLATPPHDCLVTTSHTVTAKWYWDYWDRGGQTSAGHADNIRHILPSGWRVRSYREYYRNYPHRSTFNVTVEAV